MEKSALVVVSIAAIYVIVQGHRSSVRLKQILHRMEKSETEELEKSCRE